MNSYNCKHSDKIKIAFCGSFKSFQWLLCGTKAGSRAKSQEVQNFQGVAYDEPRQRSSCDLIGEKSTFGAIMV